ncbi:LysR substrate-binding domain-containing protein [Bosea sp. PAMC 26642]|uniref:LysR substrate-binding domain-containing protein n=1 Tax=Bosea sp. (strain PAMC 26642) TaxID=1792307 RepID=UPI000A604BC9|nr:LysR substrate-binding domain-containing protein [Bosea sp. PAMC 26642]
MSRTLPPLNSVKAFEAAVRHGTTLAAAAELGVTHGAVSRQIKQLEAWIGRPLFQRLGGRLVVTEAGAAYAEIAGRALDLLHDGTHGLTEVSDHVVRVSTTASFASEWLMPRLPRFQSLHPQIDIWLDEGKGIVDPRSGGCDLAIRMGAGPWPGVSAVPLMSDRLRPVCSPGLASALQCLGDLATVPLLHDGDPNAQWSRWLDEFAPQGIGIAAGSRFASSALLLRAATDGQGVALARERLSEAWLASGRLVHPFSEAVELGLAYWLVLRQGAEARRPLRSFMAWIAAQPALPAPEPG